MTYDSGAESYPKKQGYEPMSKLSIEACATAPLADPGKTRKLSDGDGLRLSAPMRRRAGASGILTEPGGKDALMSLGVYPAVSLAKAREIAADYGQKLGAARASPKHGAARLSTHQSRSRSARQRQSTTHGARVGEDPKGAVIEHSRMMRAGSVTRNGCTV